MPTEMLDRLQENKQRGLEELINSWKAMQTGEQEQATIADALVDEGIGVRQGLLRLWDYHWTMALAGEVADRPKEGARLRVLLEQGSRLLTRAAEIARSYADSSELPVARLSQFEEQAKASPIWLEECMALWEMLDHPLPPLNHEAIADSRAAYARGEFENVADIIARLGQGGPLVKE